MLTAVLLFDGKIDSEGVRVLQRIECNHGRDILSAGYVKLLRMTQMCSKLAAEVSEPVPVLVKYYLTCLDWALRYELLSAKDITAEFMDSGKDGSTGHVHLTVCKMQLVAYIASMVDDLRTVQSAVPIVKDMDGILPFFKDYVEYERAFPMATAASAESRGDDDAADDVGFADQEPTERMKAGLGKVGAQAVDLLVDIMGGVYDTNIKKFAVATKPIHTLVWSEAEGSDALRELIRLLSVHKTVVSAKDCEGGPPEASGRVLKRYKSEAEEESDSRAEEIKRERSEAWKHATIVRRKHATVGHCRWTNSPQLHRYFEKCPSVFKFNGKVGEQHRVFVFSAECFSEAQKTPWSSPVEWSEAADSAIDFMCAHSGAADVLLFCDGRSRSCRTKLESLISGARHVSELWIVYTPTPRLGRKVTFGSDNRETAFVSLPVSRTQLSTKQRKEYTAAGELSTHDATYTGVQTVPWCGLPCIAVEDKAKIMGFEPQVPNAKFYDASCGQPLFWQERKTVKFGRRLLEDLDAKVVCDLSPGSGTCARACMDMGISYTGITRAPEHCSWLQNVLDRHALQTITTTGSPLFEQDLAAAIREHFQDLLDQLHEADAQEDMAPEDELD